MITELTRQDIADILHGATLFGAGGGGELDEGFELIDEALAAGKTFRMMSLDAVPDEALIGTTYLLGAISDLPQGTDALAGGTTRPILLAFRRMAEHLGQPIFGTLACEMGGSNTAVPFFVAAMEDAVVIDADPAGRAVPEITHSTFYLAGLPASPIAAANARGEVMLLEGIADDRRAEEVMRALCALSRNDIAAVDHALPARMLRNAVLPGTLSRAGALGRTWREGQAHPEVLPDTLAAAGSGRVIFRGTVSDASWQTQDGFTLGEIEIAGTGAHAPDQFRVAFKNENLVGWRNGAVAVTIPEIITVLDTQTGAVISNPHARAGQAVAVLVLPAPAPFATAAGLSIFGPAYAGLKGPFVSAMTKG